MTFTFSLFLFLACIQSVHSITCVNDGSSKPSGGQLFFAGNVNGGSNGETYSAFFSYTTDGSDPTCSSGAARVPSSVTFGSDPTAFYTDWTPNDNSCYSWRACCSGKTQKDVPASGVILADLTPKVTVSNSLGCNAFGAETPGYIRCYGSYTNGLDATGAGIAYNLDSAGVEPTVGTGTTPNAAGFSQLIGPFVAGQTYKWRPYVNTRCKGLIYSATSLKFTAEAPPNPPVTTTADASSIGATTVTVGGGVSGTTKVDDKGVVYSASATATLIFGTDPSKSMGSGVTSFSGQITGLQSGTTYRYRAYAKNSAQTTYGDIKTFKTIGVAVVTTNSPATNIDGSSATVGGSVNDLGGGTISDRGFVWVLSSSGQPTVSNSKLSVGVSGGFSGSITGLANGKTYNVRAYATNEAGTSYGSSIQITTLDKPTTVTTIASDITDTGATLGGTITTDGGYPVTDYGVEYTTDSTFTTNILRWGIGMGNTPFSYTFTNAFTEFTTYYYRSYAINSIGIGYGTTLNFKTLQMPAPTVTTSTATEVIANSARVGGSITVEKAISAKGVAWSATSQVPDKDVDNDFPITGTTFSDVLIGLTADTTYYARAYATNAGGTSYGSSVSFKTVGLAMLSTSTPSDVLGSSGTFGGSVVDANRGAITERGVVIDQSINPVYSATTKHIFDSSFVGKVTGLTKGTSYHVRSYAINEAGTSYGTDVQFSTRSDPTVTTSAATGIKSSYATVGGFITDNDGFSVTDRGIIYSSVETDPSTKPDKVSKFSFTGNTVNSGVFTGKVSGLKRDTKYYYNAYATTAIGTGYGSVESFTTEKGCALLEKTSYLGKAAQCLYPPSADKTCLSLSDLYDNYDQLTQQEIDALQVSCTISECHDLNKKDCLKKSISSSDCKWNANTKKICLSRNVCKNEPLKSNCIRNYMISVACTPQDLKNSTVVVPRMSFNVPSVVSCI